MLIKLLPDQISKFWGVIKYAVEQSLPPIVGDHPDKMNRILSAALSGTLDVWAAYIRDGDGIKIEGVGITEILHDNASGTKNLLIYCMYGYTKVDKDSWIPGIRALVKYAKSKGCNQVVAYTKVPYMVEMTKQLGGDADYTFASFNVDKIVKTLNDLSNGGA